MSRLPAPPPVLDTPFVNEFRLGARQWVLVSGLVALVTLITPWLWKHAERFETGPDFRIPYSLSRDYWLFERRLEQLAGRQWVVLGDSVIWGEYVQPDGTLSSFLGRETGEPGRFVNAGVNGLFPLAMEGLLRHYGSPLRDRKVLLHCNLLWMSSPQADLQVETEAEFNHAGLVPQFYPAIPAYRAEAQERFGAVLERNFRFLTWVSHVQDCYFGQENILNWTLISDDGNPPRRPNAYKNPLGQITLAVPDAPAVDPKRGPSSRRHRPWTEAGAEVTRFDWVSRSDSLQWRAFQRTVHLLRSRGNEVLVVIGPFNEHMVAGENQADYRAWRDGVAAWLADQGVSCVAPAALPSPLYADASHPLTGGYLELARQLCQDSTFSAWLKR